MKGFAAATAAKRRWKGFVVAVAALGFCSLFFPLALLLGRFPSGYLTEERSSTGKYTSFGIFSHVDEWQKASEVVDENKMKEADEAKKTNSEPVHYSVHVISEPGATSHSKSKDATFRPKDSPATRIVEVTSSLNKRDGGEVEKDKHAKALTVDGNEGSCQLEFGSYCLWSIEHKEVLKDSVVKTLKDQLFVARAYYPGIAKLQRQEKLTQELKQHIQEHEHMLSETITDADLPPLVENNIQRMDQIIVRAKSCTLECNNVDKKLRQILDQTVEEAHFHMKQSAFLYHLGAQTMPKSLHCLSMRLTVEYFKSTAVDPEQSHANKLDNPSFHHYVIFSTNVVAASVVINSTVMNSEETANMVFHLLTDRQNFYAMKHWFARIFYKMAVARVLNIEDLDMGRSYDLGGPQFSPSEEFRVTVHDSDQVRMRTEYISIFGHSHFVLPEIFRNLEKVVVLDDDVVVLRDLSSLWDLDMEGKVNGAVEFCKVRLSQLNAYLGGNNHDDSACAWMSGLNIVDLRKWREQNISGIYQQNIQKLQNGSEASWRAATLPISLLAFRDQVYPLNDSWVVSGLGQDYGAKKKAIKNALALHYNGNMKPWLDLGIPRYKKYWKKFMARGDRFMDECNVNP